uniref:Uncharacterized protein n=1 Tax=Rhizophora mucronata TaxID=61149 RepID=A0A2P2JF99_RHIMU
MSLHVFFLCGFVCISNSMHAFLNEYLILHSSSPPDPPQVELLFFPCMSILAIVVLMPQN